MPAPQKIRMPQRSDQLFRSGFLQRETLRYRVAANFTFPVPGPRSAVPLPHNAIHAAMLLISQVALIGHAIAGVETVRCWVVLDDEVVPIEHPYVAVGTHLGHDRTGP